MKNTIKIIALLLMGLALSSCDKDEDPEEQAPLAQTDPAMDESRSHPDIEISGEDFGDVIINTPTVFHVTIKNAGSLPVTKYGFENLSSALSYAGGTFPGANGSCAQVLPGGKSCTIALELGATSNVGTFELKSEFAFEYAQRQYKEPTVFRAYFKDLAQIRANNIDFGSVNVGATKIERLHLKNESSHEMIKNLSVTQIANSEFQIANPASCSNIGPGATCTLDVKFKPKNASAGLREEVTITYSTMGQNKTEKISLEAVAVDVPYFSVNGSNFVVKVVPYKKKGQVTLTLRNAPGNTIDATGIRVSKGLASVGAPNQPAFTIDPASTCTMTGAKINSISDTCTLIFNTVNNITASTPISKNIKIKYNVNGIKKNISVTLNGTFQTNLLESTGNFGAASYKAGQATPITITVHNPVQSSVAVAQDFKIKGKKLGSPLVPLKVNAAQSTCTVANKTLAPGQSCTFVLDARPAGAIANYAAHVRLIYNDNAGNSFTLPLALAGSFHLAQAKPMGALLELSGADFNQVPNISYPVGFFEVKLTLKNTSGVNQASALALHRMNNTGTATATWDDFIEIDKAPLKSTCVANTNLAPNATCDFVLRITPDPNEPMNIDKPFRISYRDQHNTLSQTNFNLKGSWTYAFPNLGPITAGNASPPTVRGSVFKAHDYFPFEKRVLKTALPSSKYPQWVLSLLNKLNATVTAFLSHVPWTFQSDPWDKVIKLGDVVPDRIMDPTTGLPYVDPHTGKKYVRLFHGTSSELLPMFSVGANSILFDKATITQLGHGFYLAASPNEAKNYACDRFHDRLQKFQLAGNAGRPPNFRPILLVVGVEEDLQGKEDANYLSHDGSWGAKAGDPKNPNINFRRNANQWVGSNNRLYNQFVFFSNSKPHMKLFEIIKLGKGFGRASNWTLSEDDGFDINDTTPDGINYQCQY